MLAAMRSASTASETSKQCLHLPCLSAPLRFEDAASDREPRPEPRCALCGSTIPRRERRGRSQMRPAQAWSPRRSNWSNPKSYKIFCPIFPIREEGTHPAAISGPARGRLRAVCLSPQQLRQLGEIHRRLRRAFRGTTATWTFAERRCMQRQCLSMCCTFSREKEPASTAAMAIDIAAAARGASRPVINSCSFLRPMVIKGFPLARRTLPRHFPGSRSNAPITNCLYSIPDPRRA